ncbi:substrate-binding domain-containing protein [Streptomyces mutabilis]|uniref:substrate-binding domain-containing protein n=1 Tax=Streptomyces mutabilis TaxID=67332 RepID=UPI000AC5ED1A
MAVDNVAAANEATTHLLTLGRRRVAAIGLQPHLHNGTAEQRAEGYRRALRRAGVTPEAQWERPVGALHREDGARAMAELLDGDAVPDAVFAFTDELALGVLHMVPARGVRVPEELAVVGFDDIEDGRYSHPTLTSVSPDKRQIAQRARQCLADRIYSPDNEAPLGPHHPAPAGRTGQHRTGDAGGLDTCGLVVAIGLPLPGSRDDCRTFTESVIDRTCRGAPALADGGYQGIVGRRDLRACRTNTSPSVPTNMPSDPATNSHKATRSRLGNRKNTLPTRKAVLPKPPMIKWMSGKS